MIAAIAIYIASAGAVAWLVHDQAGTPGLRAVVAGFTWPTWPLLILGSWLRYKWKRRP